MAKPEKTEKTEEKLLPDTVSKEDALSLELAAVYVNNAKLQLQMAEEANLKVQAELGRKYNLGPSDRIDLRNLTITRSK